MTKILTISGVMLWFFVGHAHAQSSAMVQCRAGYSRSVVPDYVCDALLDGFQYIRAHDPQWEGLRKCAKAMSTHFVNKEPNYYIEPCTNMWRAELTNWRPGDKN
jgi:hypothetical protein